MFLTAKSSACFSNWATDSQAKFVKNFTIWLRQEPAASQHLKSLQKRVAPARASKGCNGHLPGKHRISRVCFSGMNSIQHYSIKVIFCDEWLFLSHFVTFCHKMSYFVLPKFCAPDYKYHILGYKPDSHRLLLPRLSLDKSLPIFTDFYRFLPLPQNFATSTFYR